MEDSENDVSLNGNANDIIDRFFAEFKRRRIDPFPVKVNSDNFRVTDGYIRGLSNTRRSGDCTFIADDRDVRIKLQFEISTISCNLNYEVRVGLMWIKGEISAVVKHVAVKSEVSLADGKVRLISFEVTKLEDYRITQLTGVTPVFNWMLKFFLNGMMHSLKDPLLKILEKEFKRNLEDFINKLPLSKL